MAHVTRSLVLRIVLGFAAGAAGTAQSTQAPVPVPQAPARSVAELPRARIDQAAGRLDRLLAAGLDKLGLQPSAGISDEAFVRRAYLQVVGRNPSGPEAEAFLADRRSDKRQQLVDQLLDSPGYTSHEANFWFDLLRVKSRQRQLSGEPFAHWIRQSIIDGTPYDEFVAAMLTASGEAQKAGNGATGFLLRDLNMPHDAMANTMRLFLGTRMECAQCHNHPFEDWKQREFYALAAFFGGLSYRLEAPRDLTLAIRRQLGQADDRTRAAARRLLQGLTTGLRGAGTGVERLPKDYAYDDAAPLSQVLAATPFGPKTKITPPRQTATERQRARRPQAPLPKEQDSRAVFADWLTDPKNGRFGRVIVNRLWARLFGRGLTDPVDDLKADSKAVHPDLERELERLLVEFDFDLRQLQRVLLSTSLFAQATLAEDAPGDRPYAFQAPLPQRLSAEQIWDSLLTMIDEDLDQTLRQPDARARAVYDRFAEAASGDAEEILALLERPARPAAAAADLAAAQRQTRERALGFQEQARDLTRKLALARRRGDQAAMSELQTQLKHLNDDRLRAAERARRGALLRASDLEQPAPAGHLLRQFGQSDRETVDGAARAATVPQGLSLMNGLLALGGTDLERRIARAEAPREKVRLAYLGTLARAPKPHELLDWCAELEAEPHKGLQDLLWVLCNSNEYRFLP